MATITFTNNTTNEFFTLWDSAEYTTQGYKPPATGTDYVSATNHAAVWWIGETGLSFDGYSNDIETINGLNQDGLKLQANSWGALEMTFSFKPITDHPISALIQSVLLHKNKPITITYSASGTVATIDVFVNSYSVGKGLIAVTADGFGAAGKWEVQARSTFTNNVISFPFEDDKFTNHGYRYAKLTQSPIPSIQLERVGYDATTTPVTLAVGDTIFLSEGTNMYRILTDGITGDIVFTYTTTTRFLNPKKGEVMFT